ncbi:MAG TPA: peptidoglycan DD-metalloendopeptidase family protein, partial [Rhodocyclaceae bacterium]|nr:peptidoglycan DD-metalloendopeptidase family protein [Rhodocyclaceae bacterium]
IVMVTESSHPTGNNTETLKREPRGGKVAYSDVALAEARAMDGGAAPAQAKPAEKAADKPAPPAAAPGAAGAELVDWTWPVAGKVISEFVEKAPGKERIKGIEIAGRMGEPIQAAAGGKVAFISTLPSYGDFVIVHHDNGFMSVYAHTSKILVKKDQMVAKGQKIAEIGSSGTDQTQLGFEIRQQGKPVDPLKLLPAR